MTEPVFTSRRHVLKILSSVPMLPLTSAPASSTALLAACGGGAVLDSVSFSSMAAPSLADPGAMATTTVGSVMTTTFSDGTSTDFQLAYEPFFITGDKVTNLNGGTIVAVATSISTASRLWMPRGRPAHARISPTRPMAPPCSALSTPSARCQRQARVCRGAVRIHLFGR